VYRLLKAADADGGFSILEVMIAVVIFLIAFTALMSLMLGTVTTNVVAKEKANVTNAANTYIEQVRAMPYEEIGTSGGTPEGTLAPSTVTVSGFDLNITPTVTWINDPNMAGATDYKRLTVQVVATKNGEEVTSMNYSTETIIKRTDSGMNLAALPPTIDFSFGSPTDNEIVYGQETIGATASAQGEGVTLTNINFYCDGVPLVNSTGDTAQWSVSAASDSKSIMWDTTADNEDLIPLSIDGNHFIKVECWDSNGKNTYVQRNVFVDNTAPNMPLEVSTALRAGTNIFDVTWDESFDGNTPTDHYFMKARKQGSGNYSTTDVGTWPIVQEDTTVVGTTAPYTPATSINRYFFYVKAASPNNRFITTRKPDGTRLGCIGTSRGAIAGTYTNTLVTDHSQDSKKVWLGKNVISAAPTIGFPYSGLTHTLYRSTSANMAGEVPLTVTAWPYTDNINTSGAKGNLPTYYYRIKTILTPVGFNNGQAQTPVTLWSNILGSHPINTAGTGALPNAGW